MKTKDTWKYSLLWNAHGFEKELKRPEVTKIMEVPSPPQIYKAFWSKGTFWPKAAGSIMFDLKETFLSKNGSI